MDEELLPKELLDMIPQAPEEQLQLGQLLMVRAMRSQVTAWDRQLQEYKHAIAERDSVLQDQERRLAESEARAATLEDRLRRATDEQAQLVAERQALIDTVRNLSKDVSKLQALKRTLLRSLEDSVVEGGAPDTSPLSARSDRSPDRERDPPADPEDLIARALRSARIGGGAGGSHSPFPAAPSGPLPGGAVPAGGPGAQLTPRTTPRAFTFGPGEMLPNPQPPPPMPHMGPGQAGGAGGGAGVAAARTSPVGSTASLAAQSPASPQSSNFGSIGSVTPRVDGKEFFQQARARLGYEQFSDFLKEIKRLNAGEQSREATLESASRIFGGENAELYAAFEALLSRHGGARV